MQAVNLIGKYSPSEARCITAQKTDRRKFFKVHILYFQVRVVYATLLRDLKPLGN